MIILIVPLVVPVILRMLGGLFVRVGPMLVSTVMRALAISTVSFLGVKVAVDAIHASIKSNIGGMPAAAVQMLALMKFDVAIEILFAAIAGRLALQIFSGSMKKMVIK